MDIDSDISCVFGDGYTLRNLEKTVIKIPASDASSLQNQSSSLKDITSVWSPIEQQQQVQQEIQWKKCFARSLVRPMKKVDIDLINSRKHKNHIKETWSRRDSNTNSLETVLENPPKVGSMNLMTNSSTNYSEENSPFYLSNLVLKNGLVDCDSSISVLSKTKSVSQLSPDPASHKSHADINPEIQTIPDTTKLYPSLDYVLAATPCSSFVPVSAASPSCPSSVVVPSSPSYVTAAAAEFVDLDDEEDLDEGDLLLADTDVDLVSAVQFVEVSSMDIGDLALEAESEVSVGATQALCSPVTAAVTSSACSASTATVPAAANSPLSYVTDLRVPDAVTNRVPDDAFNGNLITSLVDVVPSVTVSVVPAPACGKITAASSDSSASTLRNILTNTPPKLDFTLSSLKNVDQSVNGTKIVKDTKDISRKLDDHSVPLVDRKRSSSTEQHTASTLPAMKFRLIKSCGKRIYTSIPVMESNVIGNKPEIEWTTVKLQKNYGTDSFQHERMNGIESTATTVGGEYFKKSTTVLKGRNDASVKEAEAAVNFCSPDVDFIAVNDDLQCNSESLIIDEDPLADPLTEKGESSNSISLHPPSTYPNTKSIQCGSQLRDGDKSCADKLRCLPFKKMNPVEQQGLINSTKMILVKGAETETRKPRHPKPKTKARLQSKSNNTSVNGHRTDVERPSDPNAKETGDKSPTGLHCGQFAMMNSHDSFNCMQILFKDSSFMFGKNNMNSGVQDQALMKRKLLWLNCIKNHFHANNYVCCKLDVTELPVGLQTGLNRYKLHLQSNSVLRTSTPQKTFCILSKVEADPSQPVEDDSDSVRLEGSVRSARSTIAALGETGCLTVPITDASPVSAVPVVCSTDTGQVVLRMCNPHKALSQHLLANRRLRYLYHSLTVARKQEKDAMLQEKPGLEYATLHRRRLHLEVHFLRMLDYLKKAWFRDICSRYGSRSSDE